MCELAKYLEKEKKGLQVIEMSSSCRYHKKNMEKFKYGDILGGLKCLELFHAVYPRALALMYGANFSEEELVMTCPHYKDTVTVQLHTESIKSHGRRFLNTIKKSLRPIKSMDVINYVVYVKVLSVEGHCFVGYKGSDTFKIRHTGTICPQALYSAFPSILLSGEDHRCRCPSSVNRIIFKADKA